MPFVGKHIVGMLQQIDFSTACIEDCGTVMAAIPVEAAASAQLRSSNPRVDR